MLALVSVQSSGFAGVAMVRARTCMNSATRCVPSATHCSPSRLTTALDSLLASQAQSKVAPTMFGSFGKAAPKKAAPAFCYGLPGNFNAIGGEELNFDPYGFLEVRRTADHSRQGLRLLRSLLL